MSIQRKQQVRKQPAKWWVIALVIGVLIAGGAGGLFMLHQHQVQGLADHIKPTVPAQLSPKTVAAQSVTPAMIKAGDVNYQNTGASVPGGWQQVQKVRQTAKGTLLMRGYIAIPRQSGVTNAVVSMPIYEGVSNRVLAYGAGTSKANQVMGQENYGLQAHSMYGSDSWFFSPLKNSINVNQHPKAYLTDGINVYTYQLDKKQVLNRSHGEVMNNQPGDASQARLTLSTCLETWNHPLDPVDRVIVSGHLVNQTPLQQSEHANLFK
ncbi:class A sortase [Furfurilactobacillus entadae]|uniref:class A sortase n=1 Tax=Furfurilactobacillus entadae TaxID=2922307 RepID=UPI0035EBE1BD